MTDQINYAAFHHVELTAAIERADSETLVKMEQDLAREGWSADGLARTRIRERLAALTG